MKHCIYCLNEEWETFPEEFILSPIEKIIDDICTEYGSLEKILTDLNPKLDVSKLDFDNPPLTEYSKFKVLKEGLKEFLQSNFYSLARINKYNTTPCSITWGLYFNSFKFYADGEYLKNLLFSNYSYYKKFIEFEHHDKERGTIEIKFCYDLKNKKFY